MTIRRRPVSGRDIDRDAVEKIVVGETTRAEVEERLGRPQRVIEKGAAVQYRYAYVGFVDRKLELLVYMRRDSDKEREYLRLTLLDDLATELCYTSSLKPDENLARPDYACAGLPDTYVVLLADAEGRVGKIELKGEQASVCRSKRTERRGSSDVTRSPASPRPAADGSRAPHRPRPLKAVPAWCGPPPASMGTPILRLSFPPPWMYNVRVSQKAIELILMRQLASYLSTPVVVVDFQGSLVFYNEAAERVFGLRFDETGEMTMAEWVKASKASDRNGKALKVKSMPLTMALLQKRPVRTTLRIRGRDNVARWFDVIAVPLLGHGARLIGALCTLLETTKR